MKMVLKLLMCIAVFFLSACSSNNSTGYEKVMAVAVATNGNLYVLTETLDYEFPKSRIKDTRLFFELAPAFAEIGQPISARMWVKERSVDFSFDDVMLNIYKEDHQFARNESARNESAPIKDLYIQYKKTNALLKNLEKIVKQDRSGKLALKRENTEGNVTDYLFITNKKIKNDKVRGQVVEIINRQQIIKEYQLNDANFKDFRINIFYEPSIVGKGVFGKKIEKEKLISGEKVTLNSWKEISPLKINIK